MPHATRSMMPEFSQIIIGASFVMIAAAGRFNTPPTNRSSTTALRYYLAASCYLLVEVILYFGLLAIGPMAVAEDAGFFAKLVNQQSVAPLAALLLTVLLPKVPLLAEADAKVLERLQRMGAIPFEAGRLAVALKRSHFAIPEHLRESVATRLANLGFHADDIRIDESPSLEHVWTKITALMIQLEEWEANSRFVGFLARFPNDFGDLKTRFDRLAPTIQLLRGMVREGTDLQSDRLMLHVQSEVKERSNELLGGIYNLLSRGLLQCGTTVGARAAELVRLGFDDRTVPLKPRVTLNQVIALFLAIEGTLLASIVGLAHRLGVGVGELLVQATMVSTMYSVAVLWAVYPKQIWSFARREKHDIRPVAFYFAAGLLATASSLVIRLAFQLMIWREWQTAWRGFQLTYPWTLCAFAAAFMAAWMIDDAPTPTLPRRRLRWLEGLAGGGSLLITSLVVVQWLASNGTPIPQPTLPLAFAVPTAIGFGIGYLIPTWYREPPCDRELSAETAVTEGAAAVPA